MHVNRMYVETSNLIMLLRNGKMNWWKVFSGKLWMVYVKKKQIRTKQDGLMIYIKCWNTILCLLHEKGFTGYKCTRDYEGEYVSGKKHGEGKEYCITYDYKEWNHLLQEGIWENDIFIQGRMNGVLVENVNGAMELVQIEEGRFVTKKDSGIDFLFESEEDYYWVDVSLKDGEYEIIDGSKERVLNELKVI